MHQQLSSGWNGWAAMATERGEAVELMRRGLSSLVNRKLAMGFQSWLGANAADAVAQAQRDSMAKAWLHLLHRELSRGWAGWQAQWRESLRKRERARSGLSLLMSRQFSVVGTRGLRRQRSGARRWSVRRGLSCCEPQAGDGLSELAGRQRCRCGRARAARQHGQGFAALRRNELSRGWAGWQAQWHGHCASRERAAVGEAMDAQQLSGGWNAWAAMATSGAGGGVDAARPL